LPFTLFILKEVFDFIFLTKYFGYSIHSWKGFKRTGFQGSGTGGGESGKGIVFLKREGGIGK
jgi:hypothetical protein